jgi:hypothetical protein
VCAPHSLSSIPSTWATTPTTTSSSTRTRGDTSSSPSTCTSSSSPRSTFKRNEPVIKAFCDTFYSETKVAAEYADVTYFRELNWIFPVKERSIFKITVSSRNKDIGSAVVDLEALKNIPFDPTGTREVGDVCLLL